MNFSQYFRVEKLAWPFGAKVGKTALSFFAKSEKLQLIFISFHFGKASSEVSKFSLMKVLIIVSFLDFFQLSTMHFIQRAVKPRSSGRGYKAHLNWNFCLLAQYN